MAAAGVYAGTLTAAAGIVGSAAHTASLAVTTPETAWPTVEAADLADLLWQMMVKRDRDETVHPAP